MERPAASKPAHHPGSPPGSAAGWGRLATACCLCSRPLPPPRPGGGELHRGTPPGWGPDRSSPPWAAARLLLCPCARTGPLASRVQPGSQAPPAASGGFQRPVRPLAHRDGAPAPPRGSGRTFRVRLGPASDLEGRAGVAEERVCRVSQAERRATLVAAPGRGGGGGGVSGCERPVLCPWACADGAGQELGVLRT